jgi:hypothetical protein
VLDVLSSGDQASVQFLGRKVLHDQSAAFLDEAFHAFAFFALRTFPKNVENLFEPDYVLLRLVQVFSKSRAQFQGGRRFGHLGKGFDQLFSRAVQVPQFLYIQVFQTTRFHLILLSKPQRQLSTVQLKV